jgi:ACS family glucarate transporter-like MFS transporter
VFLGGWPAIFYLTGLTGIVLAILWSMLATNSPEEHKFIKADEKNYILDKTSDVVLSNKEKKVNLKKQNFY